MRLEIKDGLKFLLGGALAVLLMAWVFRGSEPGQVAEALERAWWPGILLCGVLQFSHNVLRVVRWGILLAPVRRGVPFGPMFVAVILGYMVSWVLPGRLGELVRPALLAGHEKLPLAPAIGSVFTDRLLDSAAIVALFAGGLYWTPLQGAAAGYADTIRIGAMILLPMALVGLLGLFALARFRGPFEARLSGGDGWGRRAGRAILGLAQGSEALGSLRSLVSVTALSLATWTLIAAGLWTGILACGAEIPFSGVLILLPAIALGVALPTPGGVGGFHSAMTFGLTQIFSVDQAVAIGTGILVHLASIVPVLLVGGGMLAFGAVSVQTLRDAVVEMRRLGRAEGAAS